MHPNTMRTICDGHRQKVVDMDMYAPPAPVAHRTMNSMNKYQRFNRIHSVSDAKRATQTVKVNIIRKAEAINCTRTIRMKHRPVKVRMVPGPAHRYAMNDPKLLYPLIHDEIHVNAIPIILRPCICYCQNSVYKCSNRVVHSLHNIHYLPTY